MLSQQKTWDEITILCWWYKQYQLSRQLAILKSLVDEVQISLWSHVQNKKIQKPQALRNYASAQSAASEHKGQAAQHTVYTSYCSGQYSCFTVSVTTTKQYQNFLMTMFIIKIQILVLHLQQLLAKCTSAHNCRILTLAICEMEWIKLTRVRMIMMLNC